MKNQGKQVFTYNSDFQSFAVHKTMKNLFANYLKIMTTNTNQSPDYFTKPMDRRTMLRNGALFGLLSTLPFAKTGWGNNLDTKTPPILLFKRSTVGEGLVSAFGEVRIAEIKGNTLPIYMASNNGSCVIDASGRGIYAKFGNDSNAIKLTPTRIEFGKSNEPWSKKSIERMAQEIANDRKKLIGVLELRAAFVTTYPVATQRVKKSMGSQMSQLMAKTNNAMGANAMNCGLGFQNLINAGVQTATRVVTETIPIIKSAEQQYLECYDQQLNGPCKDVAWGFGAIPCAIAACAMQVFTDMVIGFTTIVIETIVEKIVMPYVSCVQAPFADINWPNPFKPLVSGTIQGAVADPTPPVSDKKVVSDALKLLKDISGFLGPFKCMLDGQWSLAQLNTPLILDGKNVGIPYGIKVCIGADCADKLISLNAWGQTGSDWATALSVLAALSPAAATALGALAPASPAIAALVAAAGPVVAGAAALILAVVILILIYATAIQAQLLVHKALGSFNDGTVCIEHPTFALALVKLMTFTYAPAELIPPIVTG